MSNLRIAPDGTVLADGETPSVETGAPAQTYAPAPTRARSLIELPGVRPATPHPRAWTRADHDNLLRIIADRPGRFPARKRHRLIAESLNRIRS